MRSEFDEPLTRKQCYWMRGHRQHVAEPPAFNL